MSNVDKEAVVLETILSRRSVRAYTPQLLTEEQIQTLTKAAIAAPSARNCQPCQVTVVKNKGILDERATRF